MEEVAVKRTQKKAHVGQRMQYNNGYKSETLKQKFEPYLT